MLKLDFLLQRYSNEIKLSFVSSLSALVILSILDLNLDNLAGLVQDLTRAEKKLLIPLLN
jgi:hypothetical protein